MSISRRKASNQVDFTHWASKIVKLFVLGWLVCIVATASAEAQPCSMALALSSCRDSTGECSRKSNCLDCSGLGWNALPCASLFPTRLEYLYFSRNNLTNIPTNAFGGILKGAELSLFLNHNNIRTIGDGAFNNVEGLHKLDLGHNNLSSIGANAFIGLAFADGGKLWLSDNNISVIADGAFHGISGLNLLHLGHNNIKNIGARTFKGLKFIGHGKLWLGGNKIQIVEHKAFAHIQGLSELSLAENSDLTIATTAFPEDKHFKLFCDKLRSGTVCDASACAISCLGDTFCKVEGFLNPATEFLCSASLTALATLPGSQKAQANRSFSIITAILAGLVFLLVWLIVRFQSGKKQQLEGSTAAKEIDEATNEQNKASKPLMHGLQAHRAKRNSITRRHTQDAAAEQVEAINKEANAAEQGVDDGEDINKAANQVKTPTKKPKPSRGRRNSGICRQNHVAFDENPPGDLGEGRVLNESDAKAHLPQEAYDPANGLTGNFIELDRHLTAAVETDQQVPVQQLVESNNIPTSIAETKIDDMTARLETLLGHEMLQFAKLLKIAVDGVESTKLTAANMLAHDTFDSFFDEMDVDTLFYDRLLHLYSVVKKVQEIGFVTAEHPIAPWIVNQGQPEIAARFDEFNYTEEMMVHLNPNTFAVRFSLDENLIKKLQADFITSQTSVPRLIKDTAENVQDASSATGTESGGVILVSFDICLRR